MDKKHCSKCRSDDVIEVETAHQKYMIYDRIQVDKHYYPNTIKYCCCNCGYIEEGLDSTNIARAKKFYRNQ